MITLWDWALEAYAQPGAQPALLALQDEHGLSVPYLLWAGWAAGAIGGRSEACAAPAALCRAWEAGVTGPLRQARRALKQPFDGVDAAARLALRGRIQHEELSAERLLLETLQRIAPAGEARGALAPALVAATRAWGCEPAAQARAAALADIFEVPEIC